MSNNPDSSNQEKNEALDIINNPKNHISIDQAYPLELDDEGNENNTKTEQSTTESGLTRRNFLKYGSVAAAVATVAGSAAAGFQTGRSSEAYTGWGRTAQGDDMFFNREPFRVDVAPMMTPVAEVTRPDWIDYIFERRQAVAQVLRSKQWDPSMGIEAFPGQLGDWYRERPERYNAMVEQLGLMVKQKQYWKEKAYKQYGIAQAYAVANRLAFKSHGNTAIPEDPADAYKLTGVPQLPEEWDFRNVSENKLEFKSPAHASKLIKRMAHVFGASCVAITKFDPRFMATNLMRGMPNRGWDNWGDKVPEHWKSIIVFGSPMYWDQMHTSNGYATGTDGYLKGRITAGLLENFIQTIGYPARAQSHQGYEIMISPFLFASGLAEFSRAGYAMVPEVGGNFRPAAVITDIEFEYDKPIDIGMAKFCMKCKICADTCPSGAIPSDDEPQTVVRGFKRWLLDEEKCFKQWCSSPIPGANACGVCMSVCPYNRKNTWIHTISRELEARDSTGLVSTALLAMQQNFFKYPTAEEFNVEWQGGKNANYHDPVWWQKTENFFSNIEKDWEYTGMH